MYIEDVYSISGCATFVTGGGRVEEGKVNVGDELELIGICKFLNVLVQE